MGFIYGLKERGSTDIRYVGATVRSIERRWNQHRWSAQRKEDLPVYRWMNSRGVDNIEVITLGEYPDDDTYLAEVDWIAHYKSKGRRLLNCTDGGEGTVGYQFPPDVITKLSEAQKRRWAGKPGWLTGVTGEAHPSYGRVWDKASIELFRQAKLGDKNPNYGRVYTDAERQNLSKKLKGRKNPQSKYSAHKRYHVKSGISRPETCGVCREELDLAA